jgi:hypothetical protein
VICFAPGALVTGCFPRDDVSFPGVRMPPLGTAVTFSYFPWTSVAIASPPGGKILTSVVSAFVTVSFPEPGIEEFIAHENQNCGKGVELNSRKKSSEKK